MITPIVHSFAKHKLTVVLLVVEVAITCALICNVFHLAMVRVNDLKVPTGVDESHVTLIDNVMLDSVTDVVGAQRRDVGVLKGLDGVTAVAAVDAVPLSRNMWTLPLGTKPPGEQGNRIRKPNIYTGTPGTLQALGLRLLSGRDFLDNEFQPEGSANHYIGVTRIGSAIVTAHLANEYFPGGNALGQGIFLPNGQPIRIVGIVDHLLRPQFKGLADADDSVLLPLLPDQSEVTYVLRTSAPPAAMLFDKAKAILAQASTQRLIRSVETFDDLRAEYFAGDVSMLRLLLAAGTGLIVVTIVGVAGLSNFWVLQRKRQIGIRRALGATKSQICHYFQVENLILVGIGTVIGVAFAPLLARIIMKYAEAPALPLLVLPAAVLLFLVIGQCSVFAPALKASHIAPMAAIRKS